MATETEVEKPSKPPFLELPDDLICFICVHCEYHTIIQSINCLCKSLHEIIEQFLQSNHYIYRLLIVYQPIDNELHQKPLTIAQIKYFEQYKHLSPTEKF